MASTVAKGILLFVGSVLVVFGVTHGTTTCESVALDGKLAVDNCTTGDIEVLESTLLIIIGVASILHPLRTEVSSAFDYIRNWSVDE